MKCPNCGDNCARDEVDVGVGVQYGPWGCFSCGWSEHPSYDDSEDESIEQKRQSDRIIDPLGGSTPR